MEEYVQIGKIVNTHGVKGELKVIPTTDDITRFELLETIFVQTRSELNEYTLSQVRYHKNFILIKLEKIETMTDAEKLKNCIIKIPKKWALPLDKDEYYIGDLYDMQVLTEDGEDLGSIVDVLFTGSNDVYIVKDTNNTSAKEILIPAIKECIKNVDIEKKIMTVHLLEGLRE